MIRHFCCALLLTHTLTAQQGPMLDAGPVREQVDMSELDPRVREAAKMLDKLDKGDAVSPEAWANICEACGLNPAVHGIAIRIKPFPADTIVGLLAHPKFAVRMGALEILESKSNDDFSFDPWNPASDASKTALERWKAWLKPAAPKDKANATPPKEAPLDEAKLRGYFADLAGADVSKQERAVEALSRQAMRSVAALEQYLHDTPQLTEGVRAKLKEAQYRLVIAESLPKEAAKLARQLVFGTRDLKLESMSQLPRIRDKAVPILAEFLPDTDALIREAAMDALILAGEESVYELVEQRLKQETDENVIHAVLRRVSPKTERGAKLIASFVTAPNEDLAVASLNALSDGASSAASDKLKDCLTDKRWRVRVAALEYAGTLKKKSASGDAVLAAFADSDEFVRYAAMKAAADMGLDEAVPRIMSMALKDDAMIGAAVEAIVRMGKPLPEELEKTLITKPGDVLLVVLRAFGKRAGHDGAQIEFEALDPSSSDGRNVNKRKAAEQALRLVRVLATHRDPDVRSAAFHVLGHHLVEAADKKLVYDALKAAADDFARVGILEGIKPGPFDFRESTAPEPADGQQTIVADTDDVFAQVIAEPAPRSPEQEAVYAAFGVKLAIADSVALQAAAPGERVWMPMDKEFSELLTEGMKSSNGELAFLCAMHLALGGQRAAAQGLLKMMPRLEPHQRARVAALLIASKHISKSRVGEPLLRLLLQDESPEARQDTVYAVLRAGTARALQLLLDEVARPDAKLRPVDAYSYSLADVTSDSAKRSTFLTWAKTVLADAKVSPGVKTLALTLLGTTSLKDSAAIAEAHVLDSNIWQRRAAFRALWRLDKTKFEEKSETLANDSSPRVREVLPAGFRKNTRDDFDVWFGERDFDDESAPYSRQTNRFALPEPILPLIEKLARDSDMKVRLSAMTTLLGWKHDVDTLAMREAIASFTDEKERRQILLPLTDDELWRQLGPKYGFLIDYLEAKWFGDEWKELLAVLRPETKSENKPVTSFASLVKEEPAAPAKPEAPSATVLGSPLPTTNTDIHVVFFFKPGCKDCERTRDMLQSIAKVVPMKLLESNIETSEGARWNEALCQRYAIDGTLHQIGPAVFTQAGALVKTDLTMNALQRLIDKTLAQPAKNDWHVADANALASAGTEIATRYEKFSIGWVLAAGLIDGINPCAFATIIFFLSYLHIARRRPHEILMVGGAFILAVFLAYFFVGLGLSHVIAKLQAFAWVRLWLNRVLALVALLLAWLSLRDGFKALRGTLTDQTMQLPEFLKTRIRGVIREQSKARHFVIAAFITGIIISLLELACTGQVYLPTIIYMVRQGSISAVVWLLVYNLAFIAPLIVIFLLAYFGMKSDALIAWQKKHTALVRFAMAALFVTLWMVLILT